MKLIVRLLICIFAVMVMLAMLAPSASAEDRKVKTQVQPVYPDLAKTMHLSGTVKIEVTINAQGNVKDTKVVGGHPVLADAAVKAVQRWKFEPGPEETQIIAVNFHE